MARDALELTLLLDYYGELLPEKQRTYCDMACNQDYSLAEIAEVCEVSRQSVHDALRHAEASLRSFERTLGCCAHDAQLHQCAGAVAAELPGLLAHDDPQVRLAAQRISAALKTILE